MLNPKIKKTHLREKLYSVPDLKSRGWTDTSIKQFLPEPDDTRPNPRFSHAGAPMKFWLKARVHRTEKTKRFLAWLEGSVDRSISARSGVKTRIDNMARQMEDAPISITPGLTDDEIRALAARTHGENYAGDPGEFSWSNRTARNCIRHNLTNYEALWEICNRGETGSRAYEILRKRVDELIDKTYPQFREIDPARGERVPATAA